MTNPFRYAYHLKGYSRKGKVHLIDTLNKLNEQIDQLRDELARLYLSRRNLQDPEILCKSIELDHFIVLYQKTYLNYPDSHAISAAR
jgi:hypothetical protein